MCVKLIGPPALGNESSNLPGPGLDVPVDADGDGISTYGDRYAFNYWLELGGSLEKALSAAEAGKDGVIDLSKFFRSSDAMLAPRAAVVDAEAVEGEPVQESAATGGGTALSSSSTCATFGSIVVPFGAPTTPPPSILSSCSGQFDHPTGADMDSLQGLYVSHTAFDPLNNLNNRGVTLLKDLDRVPPMGQDGTIPLVNPTISESLGFGAEDIVVRVTPPFTCPLGGVTATTYAMSTWPENGHICPDGRNAGSGLCDTCAWFTTPGSAPFALDVVGTGMPNNFGYTQDVIFSATEGPVAMIRRASNSGVSETKCHQDNLGQVTLTTLKTLSDVVKVWGLALGDFKGTGTFAVYFVAQPTCQQPPCASRKVQRLVGSGGYFVVQDFATLPSGNSARSAAFDPISGDLFVSEDTQHSDLPIGDLARIWRISNVGTVRLFGRRFNKPNGIAFHPSGVMLVVEEYYGNPEQEGNVLAVGGWRTKFKRGDADGNGTVDITDSVYINNWLSPGGPVPPCLDGADADDDSKVLAADANFIISYLFNGGAAPPLPGPSTCGRDPTPDLLDCTKCLTPGCAIQ